MQTIEQRLRPCIACGHKTIHIRNGKQISWIMHLVLTIFTLGAWLFVFAIMLIWHALTKPIGGRWTCSVCGNLESATPTFDAIFKSAPRPVKSQEKQKVLPQRIEMKPAQAKTALPKPAPPVERKIVPLTARAVLDGDAIRCGNPQCKRLLINVNATCPHCGTVNL